MTEGDGAFEHEPVVSAVVSDSRGEDPAELARLIADPAEEQQRTAREDSDQAVLPEDLLPGTREEADFSARGLAQIRCLDLRRAGRHRGPRQPAELRPERPGPEHPVVVPRELGRRSSSWPASRAGSSSWASLPMGWLADRFRRGPIIGCATFFFGLMVFLSGLATNIFLFFLARFGAGISQASTQTVHGVPAGRHLSDQPARAYRRRHGHRHRHRHRSEPDPGRVDRHRGGWPQGWRWAFYILAIPILAVAVFASGSASRRGASSRSWTCWASSSRDTPVRPRSRPPSNGS